MTNFVQLLLVIVVATLTFLVTFAAIQVFHILHEFRLVLKKLNFILENTHTLSDWAAKPITAVNEFFTEVKDLVHHTQDEIIDSTPDRVISESRPHKFFHRSTQPHLPLHSS
ncbi:MAG: hypothetical protein G01um101416_803 [Microgenomates group bacterium Gr01-1014_16]|nr:MAG: hypothetical protein G01um101416_803 [Microgenomates group bacterium Gr01-1014_16]